MLFTGSPGLREMRRRVTHILDLCKSETVI
jgi:hypothetical protein